MKAGFLNKLLERIGRLGPDELQRQLVELAKDKGFFETIFNSLQEGVLVVDPSGRISFLNPSAASMLGVDPGESSGRLVDDLFPVAGWKFNEHGDRTLTRDVEVFYPRHRFLNFYAVPLRIDRDIAPGDDAIAYELLVGYAIILRDITESKKNESENIESERLTALTLLAAGVAHELGNPLNSLHIHLQLLERGIGKLPERSRARLLGQVSVARDEIKRLDLIVSQFLNAIRPTRLELKPENINTLLQEAVEFLAAETRGKKITITRAFDSTLPPIPVDQNQIRQAFYNILKNSFQALREGGDLHIETKRIADDVVISFADSGAGISPENIARVFDPYFTTKTTGSGLGLLIVRRIIREHGGDISLSSREGEGTTVSLRLPTGERRVRFLGPGTQQPTLQQ